MSVSAAQIELVQGSWAKVEPIADTAADIFYTRLFELDPNLKPLFKTDLKSQGEKLMKILGTAVNGLNNLEAIVPVVQDMGKRHVDYGVKDRDYNTVGEALLWTLDKGLGKEFTGEVKEAWTTVYTVLSSVMIEASQGVSASSASEEKPGFFQKLFGFLKG
jgi:hemoglobin-like flavoprotein